MTNKNKLTGVVYHASDYFANVKGLTVAYHCDSFYNIILDNVAIVCIQFL